MSEVELMCTIEGLGHATFGFDYRIVGQGQLVIFYGLCFMCTTHKLLGN